jgi:hypothetical protein
MSSKNNSPHPAENQRHQLQLAIFTIKLTKKTSDWRVITLSNKENYR